MGVEQNINFLEEQERVFTLLFQESRRSVEARQAQVAAANTRISELRAQIRALKRTLVADDRAPSDAAIEEGVRIADRLRRLADLKRTIEDQLNLFAEMAADWAELQKLRGELPDDEKTPEDKRKLSLMQASLVDQLQKYGMDSLKPNEIVISPETFRATHQGFDLQFDLSASDGIRTTWAYRMALLEVSRKTVTNHPKFLVFDEPRQQETERISYRAFLARAAAAGEHGEQIIVATSESVETIQQDLKGLDHSFLNFGERILQRL